MFRYERSISGRARGEKNRCFAFMSRSWVCDGLTVAARRPCLGVCHSLRVSARRRGSRRSHGNGCPIARPSLSKLRDGPATLRAAGAAPGKRGDAVGATEVPDEVGGVRVAYPPAHLLHRQVGLDQQLARLGHAALGDPVLHGATRLAPDDRGQVPRRQAYHPRHVLERDPPAVVFLYEAEDLGEERFVPEPEVLRNVHRQPREAHEEQCEVREGRLPVAVLPQAELGFEGREAFGPRGTLGGWHFEELGAPGRSPDEREQQRVGAPGEEGSGRLGPEDLWGEEGGPALRLFETSGAAYYPYQLAGGDHVRVARLHRPNFFFNDKATT